MRTLSLGYGEASRRAPPSVDELLKGRPEAKENVPPNQENAQALATTAEASVTGANNITSGPYRPRFGKSFASMGEPNINASDYARPSSREAIGDDQATDNRSGLTFPADDTCPSFTPPQSSRPPTRNSMTPSSGGGSYSSLNPGSIARHSSALPHRPSFHRPQYLRGRYSGSIRASPHLQHGSTGSLDEDEPLLFAMSDVGTSRRSLEERERQREKGKDRAATEVAEDPELEDL
ncbi:hypothetical protein KEM55_007912 [Ascosphaera atra]|nr:hypothetical protein KEM55_007912 [Ascosphaera atra]